MTSIAGSFVHTAMRRSLLGSHANDPVVPDRAQGAAAHRRAAEDADGLTRTRRLAPAPALDPRAPAPVEAGAERRRAA
jgi:hypothetical protein